MNGKSFFKSTTFKCIIALLCVLLVSGIFLTIMNSLLAVTPEEKFNRAINKIYGKAVKTETISDIKSFNETSPNGSIEEAYKVKEDGNFLIKSTGYGGYDNGTVTCWVVVVVNGGAVKGIDKVIIDSNKAQSYIDRVGDKALSQFSELYEDGIVYTPSLITGATVTGTKNAICNAVNTALEFANVKCGNIASEAKKLLENIANIYGDTKVSVYGVDEKGEEKLIEETDETVKGFIETPVTSGKATVESLYKVRFNDGKNDVLHYVVSSTGVGGYPDGSGTVTCLTAFAIENGAISRIYKVTITANVGQSYIGNIEHLDKYPGADYIEGEDMNFVTSGATMSSTAINNAVNGAMRYIEANIANLGDITEDGDNNEGGEENE